ncbi:tetratricopeptide repeat protein [Candidatus Roizmanbacteria bacterium]|nr:tetratricopeptide repeat protein [Candidatus Roizmanbacteria bacterium]
MNKKLHVLLLVFIGFTLYLNSLTNGFVGDDFQQIVNNSKITSVKNIPTFFLGSTYQSGGNRLKGLYYRPIMLSVFSFINQIFGSDALFFHLIQIILHIANALLIYYLLNNFFKRFASFLISTIFLVHPLNNEAVVYIANLQEELFFFFGMLALLLLLKRKINYIAFFIFSLLSLFSKESGILFLIASNAYSYLFKQKQARKVLLITVVALLIYLFFRYPIAKMHLAQGSVGPVYQAALLGRLMNIPAILFYYLQRFFFPLQISSHHFWIITSFNLNDFFLPLIFLVFFFTILIIGIKSVSLKKKDNAKIYTFFLIWILAGLSLHLQILPLDATVADRWFYFPMTGILALIALLVSDVDYLLNFFKKHRLPSYLILTTIILLLFIRTWLRNFDWKNDLTLYSHDIKYTKKNFVLDNSLGAALISLGHYREAKPYILSSIKSYRYYANLNNLAIIYTHEKNYKQAKEYLNLAIKDSNNEQAYENYANFLLHYDDIKEAEAFTKKALIIFPKDANLWLTLKKIENQIEKTNEKL